MRIHTTVTEAEVYAAARLARVDLATFARHGSRKSDHAFEVKLEGESRQRPNGGESGAGSGYAATWDQWGVFLAAIFRADPAASCWAYTDEQDFHWQTDDRFALEGFPADAHGDHTWRVGAPYEQACTRCTAVRRWTR